MEELQKGHLTLEERQQVYVMHGQGKRDSEIAKIIGRDRTVVWRERKRNRPPAFVASGISDLERAKYAHDKAVRRRSDCKRVKRGPLNLVRVRERISTLLENHYSPEAIAHILTHSDLGVKLSGKTIRRWIKKEAPELRQHLPERGIPRRSRMTRRKRRQSSEQAAPKKRNISERSSEANERMSAGHLEGDAIVCRKSKTAIISVSDRKTRRRWYRKVDNLQAQTVLLALIALLREIPPALRKTITFDNGSEFAFWYKLEILLGITVYFCDPYCAWQKGTVEHSNKEFRRFVPKGTDLALISDEQIARIELALNSKPMNCIGMASAGEAWQRETAPLSLH
jgi:IS30 family transposase